MLDAIGVEGGTIKESGCVRVGLTGIRFAWGYANSKSGLDCLSMAYTMTATKTNAKRLDNNFDRTYISAWSPITLTLNLRRLNTADILDCQNDI